MATLTIQLSGSAVVNGTKSYTVSDADTQTVLTWAEGAFASSLPQSPTNTQILLAWVQSWINGTRDAVTVQNTVVTPGTPPTFT